MPPTAKAGFDAASALALAGAAETGLRRGRQLLEWFRQREPLRRFENWFPLIRAINPDEQGYGFFDTATVDGEPMPVMGSVQEMPFDWAKGVDPRHTRVQLREFVLRYLMRASAYEAPQAFIPSLNKAETEALFGFGYTQSIYREANGRLGAFPENLKHTIIDLRQLGPVYQWIASNVKLFNFVVTVDLLGEHLPRLDLPLDEDQGLVLAPGLIANEERDGAGVIGEFGTGYALTRSLKPGVLAYGPGYFDAGVKLIRFRLAANGRITVHMLFVVNRPAKIFNLPFDPTLPALRALNAATLGWAGRQGLSPEGLDRAFLLQHHVQHYQMITGALNTWAQVPDWENPAVIPQWIQSGIIR